MWIDIAIAYSCDCYDKEVEHVVEFVLYCWYYAIFIIRNTVDFILSSDLIDFFNVIVFNCEHKSCENVNSREECECESEVNAQKSHASTGKHSV